MGARAAALLLLLRACGLLWASTVDHDYGGVPIWIDRLLGEPSVLSLRGRMDRGYQAAEDLDCPEECDCPVQWPSALYCDQRGLDSPPASLPPGTQYLFLQDNNISSLATHTFSNATQIRWLFLDRNRLLSPGLAASTLANLTQLENLFMNHNQLSEVPLGLPQGLKQLRLAHNLIARIPPGALQDLPQLSLLLLQGNRLKSLGEAAFRGLSSVVLLDLSHNLLEEFPKHLPPSVQQLYLSHNAVRSLSRDSLRGFHSLRYLRLSHNRLHSPALPPAALNLSSLVELDLSYNQLTSTPVVPTSLLHLYLEANLIHEFNVSSFCRTVGPMDYSHLRILRLDGNKMGPHQLPPDWSMCLRVLHHLYI
ncbi:lumican [Conger conger]|uniref:lumican n=1 Tax=Conger conger TaxID=82655 RepID=UPI002A5A4380|nr:lumican [Conger conger]